MKLKNIDPYFLNSFKTIPKEKTFDKNKDKSKNKFIEDDEEYIRKKKYNKRDYSRERRAKTGSIYE